MGDTTLHSTFSQTVYSVLQASCPGQIGEWAAGYVTMFAFANLIHLRITTYYGTF